MALTTGSKNTGLNAIVAPATHLSLHTADPSTTGANEVTGGSPAYARKAATWASASGGSVSTSASVAFDVPLSTTVTHFGMWTASSGGTFLGGGALSASEVFSSQGIYTLSTATVSIS